MRSRALNFDDHRRSDVDIGQVVVKTPNLYNNRHRCQAERSNRKMCIGHVTCPTSETRGAANLAVERVAEERKVALGLATAKRSSIKVTYC